MTGAGFVIPLKWGIIIAVVVIAGTLTLFELAWSGSITQGVAGWIYRRLEDINNWARNLFSFAITVLGNWRAMPEDHSSPLYRSPIICHLRLWMGSI